jgi:hypothetical protein
MNCFVVSHPAGLVGDVAVTVTVTADCVIVDADSVIVTVAVALAQVVITALDGSPLDVVDM